MKRDHIELIDSAENDSELNSRSDVYQCACGFSFIALSVPTYCPGCGGDQFRA